MNESPLYIVDGSGYIFRAFYAVAPLSNSKNLPTNALVGYTRMLAKLIKDKGVQNIAVTFDSKEPTFRHEMYSEYKANRDECPEDLVPQMPYFRSLTRALGIAVLELSGVEADDIIATVVASMRAHKHPVVVVSGDKDLLQLVNDEVVQYDAMKDVTYTPTEVEAKMGVPPHQVRDLLALIGDASDNVPGVRGIGPKTAVALLQHFGSVEEIYKRTAEIEQIPGLRGAKGVREKIEFSADQLRLSYDLVGLKSDISEFAGDFTPEKYQWRGTETETLSELAAELEFGSVLRSIDLPGFAVGAARSAPKADKKYSLIDANKLPDFVAELQKQSSFAFDIETTALDPHSAELIGISFSWSPMEAYFVTNETGVEALREAIGPVLADPSKTKIGSNLKFDVSVLIKNGFHVEGPFFDTVIFSHLLHPDRRGHGLKQLAQNLLKEQMSTFEEMLGNAQNIREVPLDRLVEYACHDADATFRLYKYFQNSGADRLKSEKFVELVTRIEMPLIPVLAQMELDGIRVDVAFLEKLGQDFQHELAKLEEKIYALAGRPFNLNSPKQVGEVLFEDLKIPTKGVKKTQNGFSTDASVLSNLADEHEIAREMLEYRELFKLYSTYIEALISLVNPKTGRIHTSFNQAITATGRLSSSDPNLQNIPIKTSRGRQLRKAFVAAPGFKLLAIDYSQIELRVLAHLSEDRSLVDAFNNNEDIHERTAREIFGELSTPEERKEQRRAAKTINFGIIYGQGAHRLAKDLGISRTSAQSYIEQYFTRYSGVRNYFDRVKHEIKRDGYTETLFGRRRFLNEIETSGRDTGYGERALLNSPLQGTAAEIIKLAMLKVAPKMKHDEARLVLQVHDELLFEIREDLVEQFVPLIVNDMQQAADLRVPLKVEYKVGESWGD
jgi:DNA polymerase-1